MSREYFCKLFFSQSGCFGNIRRCHPHFQEISCRFQKFSLFESASIIQRSVCLLTGDTGLMHIGAALQVPIASLWGNTVPEFGMYPYMSSERFRIFEICPLRCRPCSKLGYKKCPKKHFNCMNLIPATEVAEWINQFGE